MLVTGSAGHLGEGLMRTPIKQGADVCGFDLKPSPYTHFVGSISDAEFVSACMVDVDLVFHAAMPHKPHVAAHSKQLLVDTNVTGTLNLLEAAVENSVEAFIHTHHYDEYLW